MAASQPTPLQAARRKLGATVSALRNNAANLADPENSSPFIDYTRERDKLLRQFDEDVDELIATAQAAVVATTPRG